jgi:hypothetical protein
MILCGPGFAPQFASISPTALISPDRRNATVTGANKALPGGSSAMARRQLGFLDFSMLLIKNNVYRTRYKTFAYFDFMMIGLTERISKTPFHSKLPPLQIILNIHKHV